MTTEHDTSDFIPGFTSPSDERVDSPDRAFSFAGNIAAPPSPSRQGTTRLAGFFERSCDQNPAATALECDGERLSYTDLDQRANRLAHHLLGLGVRAGMRVGILLDRSVHTYVTLLAVTKTEATFVPIDPAAPADRVQFQAEDAGLGLVITTTPFAETCRALPCRPVYLDQLGGDLAAAPSWRPDLDTGGDPVAYIIYTSGSSGRPKGVEIAQSSICNFIGIVPVLYGVEPTDRVYQGMTIAFDFSIEEIWPTWAVGAALVAGPTDGRRVGTGLADFLAEHEITMIYCVPTVLATLDRTLPLIRTVNVGGEACPRELVDRWGPGRRILNTYGPTEATVTCTMAELHPGKPVTIGRPLPTYRITLLDDERRPVANGEVGEICVGGPGVALGYVNRPDLTADRFLPDPNGSPGERLYRTGDLGRFLPDGELEYLGRADAEVKVRGHRVDLGEIEGTLLQHHRVTAAVVTLLPAPDTGGELAAYVIPRAGDDTDDLVAELHDMVLDQLPPYMVPSYLDVVSSIPMLPSGKADRKALPAPRGPRLMRSTGEHVAPDTPVEAWIAGVWEEAFGLPAGAVSADADFFDALGGHSLLAARIVSTLRSSDLGAGLSILELYRNPTVRSLAAHLEDAAELEDAVRAGAAGTEPRRRPAPSARGRISAFGSAQLASLYGIVLLFLLPAAVLYQLNGGEPSTTLVAQLVVVLPAFFLLVRWVLPVVGSRLLSRGLRPGDHALWSWTHLRVWIVQKLMIISPMTVLSGSPWAATYLRLAGARIDDDCHIGTAEISLPVMLDVRPGATVGYGTQLHGHRIADGVLSLGTVTLGAGATIGSQSLLEAGSAVEEGGVLREQSLLPAGQVVPAGATGTGSPAQVSAGTTDPVLDLMIGCARAPRTWSRQLRTGFAAGITMLELLPFAVLLPVVGLVWWVLLTFGLGPALVATALSGPVFVAGSLALVLGCRRLALTETPPGVHHLRSQLGLEKWLGDKLLEMSLTLNNSLYATLYTSIWLRALGTKVGRGAEVSTIANIDPDLLTLGEGSFVADMASVGSATYANGHVAFQTTEIGARAFVGNAAFVPSGSRLGDGSLIGVRSLPPTGGAPADSSWLGSPPINLPRRETYEGYTEEETFAPSRRRVRARYAIEFLRIVLPSSILALAMFGTLYGVSVLAANQGLLVTVLVAPLIALLSSLAVVVAVALLKWAVIGRYQPRVRPLWSGFVRRTEFVTGIYEAAAVPALLTWLTGTPLLGPLLRLYGTTVGRRTLVDTTYVTEFDLVTLGDDVTVGTNASLQTHLFEDRVMKMDHVVVRDRASVGDKSVVLYGSIVEEDATIADLSLVMKGEVLPPGTAWSGIPAQKVGRAPASTLPVRDDVSLDAAGIENPATESRQLSTASTERGA
ncbi:Pls/PosA family non-ribosomal peptide synthetase [Modestobacter roseus]|uniref:Non-ribosomal peptide synthetase-like protein n=1 Tax=Modestobacter roseus TaxID=1181884 RepID=A0A562ISI2_9ACTN|nr:Pls/PosA family non-ribosomal peptide synthetase [Modestobacter roseus]MQA31955.1 amino acid adenylation domain-containing protein [Modestobacter roseus]TWH73514.1 non-ribosomal peptide synthetase-like protein [Modestobacter roseus]